MANAPALHGEGAQSATVDQGEDLDHEVSVAVKVGVELGGNRGDGGEDGEGVEGDVGDEGIVGMRKRNKREAEREQLMVRKTLRWMAAMVQRMGGHRGGGV